jgi:hypothetical protein
MSDSLNTLFGKVEITEVTVFFIQETIISGVYLFQVRRMFKPSEAFQRRRTRQVLKNLIYANIFIIFLDVVHLCAEYSGIWMFQHTYKALLYSVKLKIEFVILNQLVDVTKGGRDPQSYIHSDISSRETGHNAFDLRSHVDTTRKSKARARSCHVSPSSDAAPSPNAQVVENDCILKTTQFVIQVHDTEPEGGAIENANIIEPRALPNAVTRHGNSRSPTSSEINIVVNGA